MINDTARPLRADGKPQRDITAVIDSLLPIFIENDVDVSGLLRLRSSACYLAPERMIEAWWALDNWFQAQVDAGVLPGVPQHLVGKPLPSSYPAWVRKVSAIMQDISVPTE